MVFLSRDLVALWLAHVDRFGERCIEVSAINVSLLQLPIIAYSDGNDYADGGKFCCRRECFFVVYTFCLGVTLGDKSGLPAHYVASCIVFVVEDEVAPHNVRPIRWLDQLPGAHPFVLVELSLNGFTPLVPCLLGRFSRPAQQPPSQTQRGDHCHRSVPVWHSQHYRWGVGLHGVG